MKKQKIEDLTQLQKKMRRIFAVSQQFIIKFIFDYHLIIVILKKKEKKKTK